MRDAVILYSTTTNSKHDDFGDIIMFSISRLFPFA